MSYFELLPQEIIIEILQFINDSKTFINLYELQDRNIMHILKDRFTWKKLLKLKLDDLSDYVIARMDVIFNHENIFFTMLSYYMKALKTYLRLEITISNIDAAIIKLRHKFFAGKSDKEMEVYANDLQMVDLIIKNSKKIKLDKMFLSDLSIIFSGKYINNDTLIEFTNALENGNITLSLYIAAYTANIVFKTAQGGLFSNGVSEILFDIYYNGHKDIIINIE